MSANVKLNFYRLESCSRINIILKIDSNYERRIDTKQKQQNSFKLKKNLNNLKLYAVKCSRISVRVIFTAHHHHDADIRYKEILIGQTMIFIKLV